MTVKPFEWKADQQAALDPDNDLVLTASAGTGKTTILVEKFTRQLLASIRASGDSTPLNRMLGITFTELAAAELKSRIRDKLVEESEATDHDSPYKLILIRTIRDLDSAYIGTIHGICRRILRENFIAASLSPGFTILDEKQSKILKEADARRAVFAVIKTDPVFADYVSNVGISRIRDMILSLSDSLRAEGKEQFDSEKIIQHSREKWLDCAKELVPLAAQYFAEMMDILSRFNRGEFGGKPNDKSQKQEEELVKAQADFQPFANDPKSLLASVWPESLTRKDSIPLGRHKELKERLEAVSLKLRSILALDNVAPFNLLQIANIESNIPLIRSILSVVLDFNMRFAATKNRLDQVDFDDLLIKTLRLLQDNQAIREHYHQQFRHIFVDEFQDVNPVQRDIAKLLHGNSGNVEQPINSIFVVGDGKQSIYRFRSADVQQFNNFIDEIKTLGGRQLQLESNFRSHPNLIGGFNSIFGKLFQRNTGNSYQMEYQGIVCGKDTPETDDSYIEAIELPEDGARYEGMIIARKIDDLLNGRGHPVTGKKYEPGDIAVLLKTTTNLGAYETELLRAAIPYTVIKGKGFYLQREIQDVASYLQIVWFPEDDYALAAVLRSPLCLISDDSLMMLSHKGCLHGTTLFKRDVSALLREDENERFGILKRLIVKHWQERDLKGSAEIINDLMAETDYDAFLLSQDGGDQGAANIRKLIELAREYESSGVESGLEFTLDLNNRLFTDKEESQATTVQQAAETVKIMTVHKSKGLQFPVVILPHLYNSGKGESGNITYDEQYGVGAKLYDQDSGKIIKGGSFGFVNSARKLQDEAESLRLFYVAATRAEEHLVLPFHKDPPRKGYSISWHQMLLDIGALYDETAADYGISIVDAAALRQSDKPLSFSDRSGVLPPAKIRETQHNEMISRLLQSSLNQKVKTRKFTSSVWGLINYLYGSGGYSESKAELRDQYSEVIDSESPSAASENKKAVGTAVHSMFESYDFSSQPSQQTVVKALLDLEIDQGTADDAASSIVRWFDTPEAQRIIGDAAAKIRKELEFTLNLKHKDREFTLFGTIDLLVEFSDGERWLIDYKYARSKESEQYALQLQLYAMALAAAGKAPAIAILAFLKDQNNVKVPVTGSDLESAKDLIVQKLDEKSD